MIKKQLLLFIILNVALVLSLWGVFHSKLSQQAQTDRELISISFGAALRNEFLHANAFFDNKINTPEIQKILFDAQNATQVQQQNLRDQLYQKLEKEYQYRASHFHLKQLHFHTKDNISFLRFHRPNLFGDDLTKVRKTVEFVNKNKKSVISFEEGRVYNGYRFVYPIFYKGEHVGSVETSVSANALIDIFFTQVKAPSSFVLKRSLVESKVFTKEQTNYMETPFSDDYLIEKSIISQNPLLNLRVSEQGCIAADEQKTLLNQGAFFAEHAILDGSLYINHYMPVFNTLTKTHSGYFVITREHRSFMAFINELVGLGFAINALFLLGFLVYNYHQRTLKELGFRTELLEEVQSIAQVGTWKYDVQQDILKWSDQTYRILGVSPSTPVSIEMFFELVHPEDREFTKLQYQKALEKKRDYKISHRIQRADGTVRNLSEYGHIILDLQGDIKEIVGLTKDVTESTQIIAQLNKFINTQKVMTVTMNMEQIEFANQAFLDFFRQPSLTNFVETHDTIGNLFIQHEGFFSRDNNQKNWVTSITELPQKERIVLIANPAGIKHAFSITVSPLDINKNIIAFHDITETITEVQQLTHQVQHDSLTGAYNRTYLEGLMMQIAVNPNKDDYYLILFDIDYFKEINDSLGHLQGDLLLKELVALVRQTIREQDYLIRWGGEEFVILGQASGLNTAINIAENIRKTIEQHPFSIQQQSITCSFGVTMFAHTETLDTIIHRADQAMYQAKQANRNCVRPFDADE